MTDLLQGAEGWDLQVAIWGYAVQGDLGDISALVSEGHSEVYLRGAPWDSTARDLATQVVAYGDQPYRRVADHAALPWLTEHALRGHIPWSGL